MAEGFKIIYNEILGLIEEYLNKHGIKKDVEQVINEIASPDVKAILINIHKEKVSEKEFYETFHVNRRRYRKNYYAYFERNKLDAILYPSMPNIPCKFTDL